MTLTADADIDEFRKSLRILIHDQTFYKLLHLSYKFNIFDALGVADKELPHSNLLAYILDPNQGHGLGATILRGFIHEITRTYSHAIPLETELRLDLSRAIIYRELRNIDLTIEFPDNKLVIGVENKIWAAEHDQQIAIYQSKLEEAYPLWTKVMVFLTPRGQPSETQNNKHGVPCILLSWNTLADIMEEINENIEKNVADRAVWVFLLQTIEHIRRDLMGDSEHKQLIRELFRNPDYVRVFRTIRLHQPQLADCENDLTKNITNTINQYFNCEQNDIAIQKYPPTRGLKEINFSFRPKFNDRTLPRITLTIFHWPDWPRQPNPGVLIGVLNEDTNTCNDLAQSSSVFDSSLVRFKQWGRDWKRLLKDDDEEGIGKTINNHAFDKDFINGVDAHVRIIFGKIKEPIENYLRRL